MPTPQASVLLPKLRTYLVAQGLVRLPLTAASSLPPMWLDPPYPYAPGETLGKPVEVGPDLVVSAFTAPGRVSPPMEGFVRAPHVNFRIRARKPEFAHAFDEALYAKLADKFNWMMDDLKVNHSFQFRDFSLVGSDQQSQDFVTEYGFSIWGTPSWEP